MAARHPSSCAEMIGNLTFEQSSGKTHFVAFVMAAIVQVF
jgi:hypothetical protein